MKPRTSPTTSRRDFMCSAASLGTVLGVGGLGRLSGIRPVSAREARWDPDVVRFDSSIEPLVCLLEETPREQVLEEFAGRIKQGTSYREVLTALHLAGIRNVPPRPDVGWKFHCVLVLHAAHLASLSASDQERWLPIFFALDFFKSQQAYDERESDWSMSGVSETAVSEVRDSRTAFIQAMDGWDDEAGDAAAAALVRTATREEVFELFAYYGTRDFRNIGHKPIYTANSWRTLEFVGWRHAEPMLRSLVYALLNHHDQPNPAQSELEADAPWRANQELVQEIGEEWAQGRDSTSATSELLFTLRAGTWSEASGHVAELLGDGVSPQSIQDALFAGAAELLIRQPGIVSLHGMTATNALAYAYRTSTRERTRLLLLLQNAAFLVQFREELTGDGPFGGSWGDGRIDELEPVPLSGGEPLEEIFDSIGRDGVAASGKTLAYLQTKGQSPEAFMRAARRMSMIKCKNGHDYKFSSAVMEDYARISPAWRDRYLAASVHYLRGTGDVENRLVQPTIDLLG
jgi:hypothetical protein